MKVGHVVEWKSVHYDSAKDAIHFLNEEYREDLLSVHFDYNKRDSTTVEFFYGDGHGKIRTVTVKGAFKLGKSERNEENLYQYLIEKGFKTRSAERIFACDEDASFILEK